MLVDNCSIHHAKSVVKVASEQRIELIFNQPYCPQYNGIEMFWGAAKWRFKKAALAVMAGINGEQLLRKMVAESMRSIPEE